MQYRSKPHKIEAFQFTLENIKSPDLPAWFDEAIQAGVIQITINEHKDNYISIYSTDGGVRKAHLDDWICRNSTEVIFPLLNEEFEADFELDENT